MKRRQFVKVVSLGVFSIPFLGWVKPFSKGHALCRWLKPRLQAKELVVGKLESLVFMEPHTFPDLLQGFHDADAFGCLHGEFSKPDGKRMAFSHYLFGPDHDRDEILETVVSQMELAWRWNVREVGSVRKKERMLFERGISQ